MTQDAAPAIDIDTRERAIIERLLHRHLPGVDVWVYGSRVRWNARPQSDLDLVAFASPEQRGAVLRLREAFQESSLPFSVDLLIWDHLPESFHRNIEAEYVVLQSAKEDVVKSAWHEVALGDIAEIFDGPHATPRKTNSGPVFLGISNLVSGRIELSTTQHLSEDDFLTWTKRVTPLPGDIVFSYETRLGEAAAIPKGLQCCLGRRMGLLRPRTDYVDPRFLLYAYLGPGFQETLRSRAIQGSTVDRILLSELGTFPIEIPRDVTEQRAIAHVLGTLDDKIESNRRMNQTLEAMARAIFQDWFVDFGPVRAKLEGREPYLPPELWGLFPGRLMDSELGEVPEGWEVGVLDDAVQILSGGTPKTSVSGYWDGEIPWYTAKDAPALSEVFVLTTERSITQAGVDNSSTKILPSGTTVITARGTVGRLACLGIPMAMNQTCYGIRGAEGYPDFFTYWSVRNTVSELQTRTHGTIFDTITRETFKIAETVLAPADVARAFESIVNTVMKRILDNLNESRTLAAQRDALLPKLVSGELRLGESRRPVLNEHA